MAYGIGIDTGGTYTDAVIYEFETGKVLAKGKTPTTHHELMLGIGSALDKLPRELLEKAELVSLSTTLATNACVENKGGRGRLVLVGTERSTFERVGADRKYGIDKDDVLCVESAAAYDGKTAEQPDWDGILADNAVFFDEAQALCVAGLNSHRNGGINERCARDAITSKYKVPFIMASELACELNIFERGATALLNARLLPVMARFMEAVELALKQRGLNPARMIVRSDGGLMTDEYARKRPVETILSGPAASVMGCRALAEADDCLIIDMGGTTTDISVVKAGKPLMSGGISIGGWRTQIKGVYIDTFALGGDTRLFMEEGKLRLDTRRVEPLCSAAVRWPRIRDELEKLLENARQHTRQLHEFLYLVRLPKDMRHYTEAERRLIECVKDGPQMIGGGELENYGRASERLEREGIVMRCGLTPTDIMHVRGDYSEFDAAAARIAARCFLRALPDYADNSDSLEKFCSDAYDLVKRRLFENITRVLVESAYPKICKNGIGEHLNAIIADKWEHRNDTEKPFFELKPSTTAVLVGTGAPVHIFLPDVAKVLGMECVIPENSEVANAIGAVVADVSARAELSIRCEYAEDFTVCYTITGSGIRQSHATYDEAVEAARDIAGRIAKEEARNRGAMGELRVNVNVRKRQGTDKDGSLIDLGTTVEAIAAGRISV